MPGFEFSEADKSETEKDVAKQYLSDFIRFQEELPKRVAPKDHSNSTNNFIFFITSRLEVIMEKNLITDQKLKEEITDFVNFFCHKGSEYEIDEKDFDWIKDILDLTINQLAFEESLIEDDQQKNGQEMGMGSV